MVVGLLLYTAGGWAYLAGGVLNENGAFAPVALLGLGLIFAPYVVLYRRFRPLPDIDEKVDKRYEKRHAAAYKVAFQIAFAVAVIAAHVFWVGYMRGWTLLPEHPLGPALPLIWVGFAGLLPTLVIAWTEPDVEDDE